MRIFLSFLKHFLLIHTFFISISIHGQINRLYYINEFKVLDSAGYAITYMLEKVTNTETPNEKETDVQKLLIGHKLSDYFSYLLFKNDSICTILEKQDQNFPAPPKGADTYEVFKNHETKKLSVIERADETIFHYEEDQPDIDWAIQSDRKTILTYPCQKATAEFRGRKYEAWFTFDIPISDGPYKFGGLPGLILEIYDTQRHYVFSCIGVQKLNPSQPIKTRNWRYTETSREEINQLLERKYKNPTEYYNALGVMFYIKKDGKIVANPKDYSQPYNPIELN